MSDIYGGLVFPVPPLGPSGAFPEQSAIGDKLLGYVGDFMRTILTTYVGDAWKSVNPGSPLIRTLIIGEPEEGFNDAWLPALYVFRPGKETRETVETFEQIADDYRLQKGRVSFHWIMDPYPQEQRRRRNEIVDAMRKVIDRSTMMGRDPAWKVPGDTDLKTPKYGSSLAEYAGFATLELQHAAPSKYIHRMMTPAPPRSYASMRGSFICEERLEQDINDLTDPTASLEATYTSPDQGTGLGPLVVGEAEYT